MTGSRWSALTLSWSERLTAGLARTPAAVPGGDVWLLRSAAICLIAAAGLDLIGGYHAGFIGLNALAAGAPSGFWQGVTALGDERVPLALSLFFSMRHPRLFWTLVLAALIAALASRGLKELFDAARPPAVLAAAEFNLIGEGHRRASFPSGHSVTAAVFCGVLIERSRWVGWRVLCVLAAVFIGFSRVAVGVHWPVDVATGLMVGALAAWLGGRLAARWPAPAARVGVHLPFVVLAALLSFTLLYDSHGYPDAALMLRLLGLAALGTALWQYLAVPLLRRRG